MDKRYSPQWWHARAKSCRCARGYGTYVDRHRSERQTNKNPYRYQTLKAIRKCYQRAKGGSGYPCYI